METQFRIVRRAFGVYTEIETIEVSWMAAMNIGMMMEAYNNDGEYMVYRADESYPRPSIANNTCPVQAAFAYL